LVADAQGRPLGLKLTEGQVHDSICAREMLNEVAELKCVLADKGYDSDDIRRLIEVRKAECVIPPKSNRLQQFKYDREKYKQRSAVEMAFCFFKQSRRFSTRYEKTHQNYFSVCLLCAIKFWLRY
jgi:transposase